MYYFFKGRIALFAFINCLDLKSKDEVIVPAYTVSANFSPLLKILKKHLKTIKNRHVD